MQIVVVGNDNTMTYRKPKHQNPKIKGKTIKTMKKNYRIFLEIFWRGKSIKN
jgi:hypothetical protein